MIDWNIIYTTVLAIAIYHLIIGILKGISEWMWNKLQDRKELQKK